MSKILNWEIFSNNETPIRYEKTKRIKVPGGWIINTWHTGSDGHEKYPSSISEGLCFFPDPAHEWEV
jgi:hypothetical protein